MKQVTRGTIRVIRCPGGCEDCNEVGGHAEGCAKYALEQFSAAIERLRESLGA